MAVTLGSLEDTEQFARALLERTSPGVPLLLVGPLGAGKTTLVQALGRALGSAAHISSPTYTLVHEYPTPEGPFVHIDAYRLGDADALFALGLEDYLERARLTAVEWGEGGVASSIERAEVVSCSEASWRMLGLSFAGWNAVISALLAGLAAYGAGLRR